MTIDGGVATAVIPGAAQGVAAYADDWVGFRGIEVEPEHRRRGLARAIMAALLEWGAERGATTAYLQVLGHNAPGPGAVRRAGLHDPPRLRVPDARELAEPRRATNASTPSRTTSSPKANVSRASRSM